MKQKRVYKLDEEDEKAIDLFVKLGMPRNLAKTLMYVSQVDECCSSEIEQGADMRQPEVSIAMQELRRRGWVKKHNIKKKGKGRPIHAYQPTTNLPSILKTFEQEKIKEVEHVKNDISELKTLITTP
jgi:predicted transcriptional regulator